ncbi:hypothetical protein HKCCSP123_07835 [Rhodobacterales bacterium HKCCSP123]|nr:hypothetical protein [Rhodobacterales bacterium HKCCSP123]
MRNGLQKYVHCVGFAGAGKTTLVDALERNFPGQILSASRNFERAGRLKRLRANLSAMRYVPRIIGLAAASRPRDLGAYRKLVRLFYDHYRKLECAALRPFPFVVFDEGIPHKIRAMRRLSRGQVSFADLSGREQRALTDRVDCVIVLQPPLDVWRERCLRRGLETGDRTQDAERYQDSLERTLSDVRAIGDFNPGIPWMLTEATGDVDTEARCLARRLLAEFVQ